MCKKKIRLPNSPKSNIIEPSIKKNGDCLCPKSL